MKTLALVVYCGLLWGLTAADPVPLYAGDLGRRVRETVRAHGLCSERREFVNTTQILAQLREQIVSHGVDAYVVNSGDEHQSEYTAEYDDRRQYVSGFSGSAGDAVITRNKAAMWTDSRYFLQAEAEMDDNWILMKMGEKDTPTIEEWLGTELQSGQSVAMDPKISTFSEWQKMEKALDSKNISLKLIADNLVDAIWGSEQGRPPYPETPLIVHDVQYAGVSWEEKLGNVRGMLKEKDSQAVVISSLVEVAWLLNLRGDVIPFTPVFQGYVVIEHDNATLYIPRVIMSPLVQEHLNSENKRPGDSVQVKEYEQLWADLKYIAENSDKILLPGPYSMEKGVSYLIYNSFPKEKITIIESPVAILKNVKNDVEARGMRNAHIKDAVALCQFLARIEKEVSTGDTSWDELKVVEELDAIRNKQNLSFGPSFGTIAASGGHAALPHYQPGGSNNAPVNKTAILLIDSGGQYLDGTTDVTRTMHYGMPSDFIKKVYTTLLIGCIELATVTFKKGHSYKDFELLVRGPLYALGLNYGHGTTHGIGMFLSVHEAFDQVFKLNYFGSQEPGYYKENDFGIRLENIVTVVKANVTSDSGDEFYTYETVTLVPYERNLIDVSLLQPKHIEYIDSYHAKILKIVGDEMNRQGLEDEYDWLVEKTEEL